MKGPIDMPIEKGQFVRICKKGKIGCQGHIPMFVSHENDK